MNDDTLSNTPAACAAARATLQELMDGPVEVERRTLLDAHLTGCEVCREVRRGLDSVRAGLRALPRVPLADTDLEEVWNRTVNAKHPAVARWQPRFATWAALAASLLLVAMIIEWSRGLPPAMTVSELELHPEQIEQVRQEARQVLELTAAALKRGERVAVERVLEGEISPAIRTIGIRWPETSAPKDRRSDT